MHILVLTDVLPAPILSSKKQENDVLFLTADLHEGESPGVKYTFAYLVPYSNFLFSLFSLRWKEFLRFQQLGQYVTGGRKVTIIRVPYFSKAMPFKGWLIKLGYLFNRKKLKQLVADHGIDLVHAHNVNMHAGMAYHLFKETGVPYVVTTRKLENKKIAKVFIRYLKHAKALINLGYAQQAWAETLNIQSYLVPHGIGDLFLSCCKSEKPREKSFRMVSLCRLLPWKNIDQVLRALDQIDAKIQIEYAIYGDGPDLGRLQALVEAGKTLKSRVKFFGHIPYEEVPETLVAFDVFMLPSYLEIFGRVYIEAMACGLPVIGAKNCGIAGYLEEGVQGFLVDHREVAQIREAVLKLIQEESLRIGMGKSAKELSAHFSWKAIVKRIDKIYQISLGAECQISKTYPSTSGIVNYDKERNGRW